MKKYLIKNSLSSKNLFFASVIIVMGLVIASSIIRKVNINKLHTFASLLDYRVETELATYKNCWGIFSTNCGEYVYFTTKLSKEELQAKIDLITSRKELPSSSAFNVLNDINLKPECHFAMSGDRENNQGGDDPLAYRWSFDKDGKRWTIIHYGIYGDKYEYSLNGKNIDDNIVTIMLKTKL